MEDEEEEMEEEEGEGKRERERESKDHRRHQASIFSRILNIVRKMVERVRKGKNGTRKGVESSYD